MILKDAIRWNYLYFMTAICIVLIILFTALGNNMMAVLLVTSLIVWWSYIPGFTSIYLKEIAMGDFFAVLLVPYYGPFPMAVWGMLNVCMMMVFGKLERPVWVFRAAPLWGLAIFIIPFLFRLAHGNTLLAMYYFTIVFYIIMGIFALIISPVEFFEDVKMVTIAVPLAFVSNTGYLVLFGPFTENLIKNGMKLDFSTIAWLILILVFIVVFKGVQWYAKRYVKQKNRLLRRPGQQRGLPKRRD